MRSHVTSSSTYGYNGATQNFLLPFQAYSVRYPNGNQAQAGLLGDLWSNQYFAINVGPVRVIVLMNFIPFGTQCYERFAFTHSVHCHRLMFSLTHAFRFSFSHQAWDPSSTTSFCPRWMPPTGRSRHGLSSVRAQLSFDVHSADNAVACVFSCQCGTRPHTTRRVIALF